MTWLGAMLLLPVWLLCFWYLYILVMGLYRAWLLGHIKKWSFTWWCALPALFIGYVVDLVSNWTIAVLWFGELPLALLELVTDRLTRYLSDTHPAGRNKRHAKIICAHLLDYFDPRGSHCTPPQIQLQPEP